MLRVSAIIPTAQRPQLLLRAVNSVLAQTVQDFEIIVVIDGPNQPTLDALREVADPRLRVIQNATSMGPGVARNIGVAAARAPWVAFLDDDDEWLPLKLERQLAAAEPVGHPVIVSSLSYVVTPHARYIWPRRTYDNATPFDEYLFDRRSLTLGETFVPTPSLLVSRALFDSFQFPPSRQHEDYDFLLRAVRVGKAPLITVPEPLTVVYAEEQRTSLSSANAWKLSLDWIGDVRPPVGRRAYSGFCLATVGPRAAAVSDYRAFFTVLRAAFTKGAPRPVQLAFYLSAWLVPISLRRRVRGILQQRGAPQPRK